MRTWALLIALSGNTNARRKKRFAARALVAGEPSGNQIQRQSSKLKEDFTTNSAHSGWGRKFCHGNCSRKFFASPTCFDPGNAIASSHGISPYPVAELLAVGDGP